MFNNVIIKYTDHQEETVINTVEHIVYHTVWENLPLECYQRIIQKFGGVNEAHRKMRIKIPHYDEYIQTVYNQESLAYQYKTMAYHIIDMKIVEYDQIIDDSEYQFAVDVSHLW